MQATGVFDAVLKNDYQGPIREQINQNTNLLKLFTKADITKYEWVGKAMIVPLHKGRNVGVKSAAENGLLPSAGSQQHDALSIPMRFTYGRIQVTAPVMKASRNDKGAFARAMDVEQKGLIQDISRQRNRQLAGAGQGILAVISNVAAPAITLKNPGGVTGTTNPVRFIPSGTVIAVHNGASSIIRGTATVVSVDSASQITVDAVPAGAALNDVITLGASSGSTNEGSYQLEPMGILGLVDSTTYVSTIFGIDRSAAANSYFRSLVNTSTGALTRDLLFRFTDNAEEISGTYIDRYVCHQSVRREYLKLQEGDLRWPSAGGNLNPDVGSPAQKNEESPARFSGNKFVTDKDMAYGTLIGLNLDHLYWAVETEGEWADEDGGILLRGATQDNYEGRYRVFENFFLDQGSSAFRLDGVNATVTSNVFSA